MAGTTKIPGVYHQTHRSGKAAKTFSSGNTTKMGIVGTRTLTQNTPRGRNLPHLDFRRIFDNNVDEEMDPGWIDCQSEYSTLAEDARSKFELHSALPSVGLMNLISQAFPGILVLFE